MNDKGKLVLVDGLVQGEVKRKQYSFGVSDRTAQLQINQPLYFNDLIFVGTHNRYDTDITRRTIGIASNCTSVENIHDAFTIDPKDHMLVLDAASRFRYGLGEGHKYRLFEIEETVSIKEINLDTEEYLEVQKFNAIEKLNEDEIRLLGLEHEAVHLKLKYGNTKSGSRYNNLDDPDWF